MRIKRLRFPGSQDHSLGAQLDLPDAEPPSAYAVFAHCFTCTQNLKAVDNLNRALTQRGIPVLRFDFTGLGESEGGRALLRCTRPITCRWMSGTRHTSAP